MASRLPAQESVDGLKGQCDGIQKEMIKEFDDENPRLLGPSGLGGTGVNVMLGAYLNKWKIIGPIDIQRVQNKMLVYAEQAEMLLGALKTRSPKHLIMFARVLERMGMRHQLYCLDKEDNAWVFEDTDEEMYARLDPLYPDKSA